MTVSHPDAILALSVQTTRKEAMTPTPTHRITREFHEDLPGNPAGTVLVLDVVPCDITRLSITFRLPGDPTVRSMALGTHNDFSTTVVAL